MREKEEEEEEERVRHPARPGPDDEMKEGSERFKMNNDDMTS